VNDEAIKALAGDPTVFRVGYALATIVSDPDPPRGVEFPDGPAPQLSMIEPATLREHMANAAEWIGITDCKGKRVRKRSHPPDWSIKAVYHRKVYPGIRRVECVIEAPTLRPDGSLLCQPGYDRATRLFLRPNIDVGPIPERPIWAMVEASKAALLEIIQEFPFKDDNHGAVWLCGLLTAIARHSFEGPCPLFINDGNVAGAGKSMLVDAIGVIATGRRMPRSSWPKGLYGDDEMRKRITSMVIAGTRFVLFDNIDAAVGGGAFDAILTGDAWDDRILGVSKNIGPTYVKTIFYGSGNNVTFRGDTARRAMLLRLESTHENPENRTGFKIPKLIQHIARHRAELLRACLIILRAYRAAGAPDPINALGSFEDWTHAIASPVKWVTGWDPFGTRADVKKSDRTARIREALLAGWIEVGGEKIAMTVANAFANLESDKSKVWYPTLRAALAEIADKGDMPSAKTLGKWLGAMRDVPINGKRIVDKPDRTGISKWLVVAASPP
jgi:hypothetical protein